MSMNDLMDVDLTPVLLLLLVVIAIGLFIGISKHRRDEFDLEITRESTENGAKLLSKEFGELPGLVAGVNIPVKGVYGCTLVFERENGSRMVLKSKQPEVYEKIVVGDVGTVRYKNDVLTGFTPTVN